ncbi:hypothetical protein ACIA5C_35390 [Actinoplanes sp. NPDC051343]|uniref:hypothetical protein n=1 Tax=Actinoplanes sp. NPDC051343 TaxID=3363906 RepID=UPI003799B6CB
MAKPESIRSTLGPIDGLWVVLALVVGGWKSDPGVALLCAIAMAMALGVWRLVRIQAKALEYQQADYVARDEN